MTRHPIDYEIDETPPPERRLAEGAGVILSALLTFVALLGFAVGYAMGDVPEYEPGPGFEMCKGSC